MSFSEGDSGSLRRMWFTVPVLLAIGAIAGGCGDDAGPALRYRMIGLAAAQGGACPAASEDAAPVVAGATQARLTYLDHETRALRCDVILPVPASDDDARAAAPVVAVPDPTRPVDVVVEYLDDVGAVLARGEAAGVDLAGEGTIDVRVAPSGAFACAPEQAVAPRAFHSATRLPTGELLLLGGVAGPGGAAPVDPATGLFLQPLAEIVDPETGRARLVTIPGLVARAFHEAYVVAADDATVTIAVLGGMTVNGDPATTPVAVVGTTLRLAAAPAAIGAPGQLLRYDLAAGTFTSEALPGDVLPRAFGALPPVPAPAIADVGGFDLATAGTPARVDADVVDPASGTRVATVALRRPRIGATVTALAPDTLLVWGGDPQAGDPMATPELGEVLTAWTTAPAAAPLTLDPSSEVGPMRAFGAAALAGDSTVIIGGGFRMELGVAITPAGRVVQRLSAASGTLVLTTLLDETGTTAAGYTAAVTLPDGDVLLTGGNPDPTAAGCAPDAQGLVCAIPQALRYDTATGGAAATGSLGVARYGHRTTVAADGRVIVTGGLGVAVGVLHALTDVEIYEPRGTADDVVVPPRAPGNVAMACRIVD